MESTPLPALPEYRFKDYIQHKVFVRFHMALMIFSCVSSGLLITNILLSSGVDSMLVRYPIAILGAYAVFFLGVRVWIWYLGLSAVQDSGGDSGGNWLPRSIGRLSDIGSSNTPASFGGGSSGGAGATGSFGTPAGQSNLQATTAIFNSGNGPAGGTSESATDVIEDAAGTILKGAKGKGGASVLVVGLLVLTILVAFLGSSVYMVYQAPNILSDAALNFALAGGLLKSARKMRSEGWAGSVFRATWIPVAAILILAVILAMYIQYHLPNATRLSDVWVYYNSLK